jgi:tetratricopeptide (TPR) repeat protein
VKLIDINPTPRRAMFIAAVIVLAIAHWYIGKWGLGNMVSTRAERIDVANVAVEFAPADPQTHYAAAVLYDKTFMAADQQRSLNEYEQAVALSSNNYILWLEYGKALERSGDSARAGTALKRALELAPNYAAVQWALGNLLVRNGETAAGFEQIRKAVEGNPDFAGSAAAFAYRFFDGDLDRTRSVAGSSPRANAALALLLAKQNRFDEAEAIWQAIGQPNDDSIITAGTSLVGEFIKAKKYGLAQKVDSTVDSSAVSTPEKVRDGGFEEAIKLDGATPFEWQIESGTQPQVLQSTSQPHGGTRSLVLRYSSDDGSGVRAISQMIVVRPNTKYTLSGFYHSDLKPEVKLVWQVADAASGAVITEIPLQPAGGWTQFSGKFSSPSDADAIILRMAIKSCGSGLCPVNGSVWLDDIDLKPI